MKTQDELYARWVIKYIIRDIDDQPPKAVRFFLFLNANECVCLQSKF